MGAEEAGEALVLVRWVRGVGMVRSVCMYGWRRVWVAGCHLGGGGGRVCLPPLNSAHTCTETVSIQQIHRHTCTRKGKERVRI